MINANQITARLRMMSDQDLQRFAEMHKQDPYMFPLAFNESNMRKEMRSAPQGQGAAPQAPVNQQALAAMQPAQLPEDQGIGALNPNMQFADGGLVSFAGGGESTAGPYARADDRDFGTGGVAYADGGTVRFAEGREVPALEGRRYSRSFNPGTSRGAPSTAPAADPELSQKLTSAAAQGATPEQLQQIASDHEALKTGMGRVAGGFKDLISTPLSALASAKDMVARGVNALAGEPVMKRTGAEFEFMPRTLGGMAQQSVAEESAAYKTQQAKAAADKDARLKAIAAAPPAPEPAGATNDGLDLTRKAMWGAESGDRQWDEKGNLIQSPKKAFGRTQLLEGTARDMAERLGIPFDKALLTAPKSDDPEANKRAEAYNLLLGNEYTKFLNEKYKGDREKVVAGYNAGPGRLDRIIKEHGADWRDNLPEETAAYLAKVNRTQQAGPPDMTARAPGAASSGAAFEKPGSAPSAASSAISDEGIAALSKQFDTVAPVKKMLAEAKTARAERESKLEEDYKANRPAPESFKERRAALEEGQQDVDKQQRMNEGLAWLTFASRVVQPGKTAIQALVEGAGAGAEQYSKAQGELKKSEKERKMAMAALSESERAAERGEKEKAQARRDAAALRMENSEEAGIKSLTHAYGVNAQVAAEIYRNAATNAANLQATREAGQSRENVAQIGVGARSAAAQQVNELKQMQDWQKAWNDLGKRQEIAMQYPNIRTFEDYVKTMRMEQAKAQGGAGRSGASPLSRTSVTPDDENS